MISRSEIDALVFPNGYATKKNQGEKINDYIDADKAIGCSDSSPCWPILAEEAYNGLAGDIVRTIEPQSEADPVAILINLLLCVGNAVGAGPYFKVGSTRHYPRGFAILVGDTSKGRKGLSWDDIKSLLSEADPPWGTGCIKTGLSSGEGLIYEVRDRITKKEPIREGNPRRITGYEDVIIDQGVSDKRRLIIEPEFSSTLTVMGREGNILSAIIRQAWDDGILSPMTKSSPITSTGAHISIIGHITIEELLRKLSETEKANGFGNRFLWLLVRRSKCLPEGGFLSDSVMDRLSGLLRTALNQAKQIREMTRDPEARKLWAAIYPQLSEGRPGLTGALLSRAEAHVLRLSMFYALLDGSAQIQCPHLEAALALWDYVEASVKFIFGNATGDLASDRILRALKEGPLTETKLHNIFGRNLKRNQLERSLGFLVEMGCIEGEKIETSGRPAIRWRYTKKTN